MKKLWLFVSIVQLACVSVQTYAMEAPSTEPGAPAGPLLGGHIFKDVDQQLAGFYPQTLAGVNKVDDSLLSIASRDTISLSKEELETYRHYVYDKLFTFLEGLRERNPAESASAEFNTLFEGIQQEAQKAAASALHKIDWALFEVMYLRALLLASGGGDEAAQDLLSVVPGMALFFGSLRDTPPCLMEKGSPSIPAWKYSSLACMMDGGRKDTRGSDVFFPEPTLTYPLDPEIWKEIKKASRSVGLTKKHYVLMPGVGKIGLTTLLKMWLHHAYPVPLTYDNYKAHGIELGAAVGAMHDKAHGALDNRGSAVKEAILNLLKPLPGAGKSVKKAMPLAARHMVERYKVFNSMLLAFVEAKEGEAFAAFTAASGSEERKAARQQYNRGIVPLFQALHEAYALHANVLEAPSFGEAMDRLAKNATEGEDGALDQSSTFFNPASLSDGEIFHRLKGTKLESIGVHPPHVEGKPLPTTLGEYQDALDMETLKVQRGPVYTQVTVDANNGKVVRINVSTTPYLVNTAADENALLGLVGLKVAPLDMGALFELPEDEASRQVTIFLTEVADRMSRLITGLKGDMLAVLPGDVARYNTLVATQNAEWQAYLSGVPAVGVGAGAGASE